MESKVYSLKDVAKSIVPKIKDLYDNKIVKVGLRTGFIEFDKVTTGFQPGDLIVVAGRSAIGKTAFVTNIAEYISITSRQTQSVAYFSLEMSKEALITRILSSIS